MQMTLCNTYGEHLIRLETNRDSGAYAIFGAAKLWEIEYNLRIDRFNVYSAGKEDI